MIDCDLDGLEHSFDRAGRGSESFVVGDDEGATVARVCDDDASAAGEVSMGENSVITAGLDVGDLVGRVVRLVACEVVEASVGVGTPDAFGPLVGSLVNGLISSTGAEALMFFFLLAQTQEP